MRKGRYLAFNATTGNAEVGPTQTDATAIASVTSDIVYLLYKMVLQLQMQ